MAKIYRVAVIGRTKHGAFGHGLDVAWNAIPNTKVVAVADDDKAGLATVARRLKLDRAFLDYRQMLEKVDCDIVAVCPRWVDQHRDMSIAASQHGRHIYMEKPLCRTLAEADEIIASCEKHHVKLAVAHPTRYSPKIETIKRLIAAGRIGQVLEYRGRGKEDRRGGGEDLWVLGTHVMDMIRAIGGHPQWCYAQVTQKGRAITKADVVEGSEGIGALAGDAVHALFGMKDGSTAHFNSVRNMAGRPSRYGLMIHGSKGILELIEGTLPSVKYLNDSSWSPARSGAKWQNVSSAGIDKPEPLTERKYAQRHTLAILDFLDAIENDRQPLSSMYEARGATEMIAACFESQRIGGRVQLPLKNRQNPLELL